MDKKNRPEHLSQEQYQVCFLGATEAPFTGKYYDHWENGFYTCVVCEAKLFQAETKFESGSGWPSFFTPVSPESLIEKEDLSFGRKRIEVQCAKCESHLGHVFPDGPPPTGLRFCINSASLNFHPQES